MIQAQRIMGASINHSDGTARRVRITLWREPDNSGAPIYRWHQTRDNADCEVSGRTIAEATRAAGLSWGSHVWDLRFGKR